MKLSSPPHPQRVSTAFATLVLSVSCLAPPALAQIDYEDYTFITLAGQAPGWFDGTGAAALFNEPFGVAVNASGNVYVGDTGNNTIRKVTSTGVVTTVAGLAVAPAGATDGRGQAARFHFPSGVAVDGSNNVYVADSSNHTIRRVTPAGVVTTLAGLAGVPGGVDGSGTSARFNSPQSVAVDGSGNVYVADSTNCAIRKITPAGLVSTLAGKLGVAGTNDAATGTAARFNQPYGVAVDNLGNVYVGDTRNQAIRKISPGGAVTTLAGLGGIGGSSDGTNSGARFNYPCGVAVDASGNVYVADEGNNTIRQVSPAGVVTTLAGSTAASGWTNGTGSGALFYQPVSVAVDANGNVYVADTLNSTIRKVTTPGGVVTTLAGTPSASGSSDGAGGAAHFNNPCGVAVDGAGTLYVSDLANNTIRQITPAGVVTTLAGSASSGTGTNDGTGSAASFANPAGVAVDTNGNVYVADYENHTIRKIAPGGIVTTLAGESGVSGFANGTGKAARFSGPLGVAVDTAGNVYVADTSNHLIRKITAGGTVSTLAGVAGTPGAKDGRAATALFTYPQGVAVNGSNNVYVADTGNSTIRKITPQGVVSTLAGQTQTTGASDGIGSAAQFNNPFTLTVDSQGRLYVVDTGNNAIRKLTLAGTNWVVTTLAGVAGQQGGADGTGPDAAFNFPEGVAVDANGNVYATSAASHTIRKGNPALPDMPVVDPAFGPPATLRQFEVTNLTATSWSWGIVRYPATSSAQLSSTTNQAPTLTPDVSDLFMVRFQGSDNLGRATIGTLWIADNLTPPTVGITEPTPNQQVFASSFTVTGTAVGDVGVAAVWCQLNGGPWIQAVGTLDWAAEISLTNQRANTLSAYAVDGSGKFSTTNTVSFTAGTLQVSGEGTISPTYPGLFLVVGKSYTLTAKPASGYIFTGWTNSAGNYVTTNPRISFTMTPGQGYEANFILNPFIPLEGTYAGLFADTNNFSPSSAGAFSATLTGLGSFTAQLQLGGSPYRFSGSLSPSGAYSNYIPGPGGNPLAVYLQLDLSGSQGLTGFVSSSAWSAGLTAYLAVPKANLAQAGKNYTLMIPGAVDPSAAPGGYGFGTLGVNASGNVKFSGMLGDGTKVSASSVVAGSGQWPLCLAPYSGKGLVWGWVSFVTNNADQETVGQLTWLKLAGAPGALYPNGFTNGVQVMESLYAYTNGTPVLNWPPGAGVIELDGGLFSGLTNGVTLGANNKLSGTNKLSLTLTTASGLFQGTVPVNGSRSGVSVSGVLLRGSNAGYGLFLGSTQGGILGPSQSGSVYLGPE